jgi:hypothetical protein
MNTFRMPFWRKSDRGASLVESALASLVLIITLLGILEFSLFFRDYLSVKDAADTAAGEAASFGSRFDEATGITADAVVVAAIRNATGVFPAENIEKIVVWQADIGSKSAPPEECINSTVAIRTATTKCNVYEKAAIGAVQSGQMSYFACEENGQTKEPIFSSNVQACGYPSFTRKDEIGQESIDYVGVYIRVRHNFATSFFSEGMTISAYSVKHMEVRRSESQRVIQ